MKKVILNKDTFDRLMEVAGFSQEYMDDSEDFIKDAIDQANEEAASKTHKAVAWVDLNTVHELACDKELYDTETEEQDKALVKVFA